MSGSEPSSLLEALGQGGTVRVPANRFEEVAAECDRRAESEGDARFPVLEEMVLEVLNWWSPYDESGGVPKAITDQIDASLIAHLPGVLAASSPADGYVAARRLRAEIRERLTGPAQWSARGYTT